MKKILTSVHQSLNYLPGTDNFFASSLSLAWGAVASNEDDDEGGKEERSIIEERTFVFNLYFVYHEKSEKRQEFSVETDILKDREALLRCRACNIVIYAIKWSGRRWRQVVRHGLYFLRWSRQFVCEIKDFVFYFVRRV